MIDLCPTCGQARPRGTGYLTPRELDVLLEWWMCGSVRGAAERAGVGQQRAKNMLARARIRNGVRSNDLLLATHLDAVRSRLVERTQHNSSGGTG